MRRWAWCQTSALQWCLEFSLGFGLALQWFSLGFRLALQWCLEFSLGFRWRLIWVRWEDGPGARQSLPAMRYSLKLNPKLNKVGLVPDNRFQQCAIDAEALGLQVSPEQNPKLNSELSLNQTLSAIDAGALVLLNEISLELNSTLNSKLYPKPWITQNERLRGRFINLKPKLVSELNSNTHTHTHTHTHTPNKPHTHHTHTHTHTHRLRRRRWIWRGRYWGSLKTSLFQGLKRIPTCLVLCLRRYICIYIYIYIYIICVCVCIYRLYRRESRHVWHYAWRDSF